VWEVRVEGEILVGLYLCVFDGDDEIEGVEVGPYADFGELRDYVVRELEGGKAGTRFPTFILHSDCDGEWSVDDATKLSTELEKIVGSMKERKAVPFVSEWQSKVAKSIGLVPKSAFESFVDVDGEFVLMRIHNLVRVALEHQLPILFQ
jgi:hypothetical protein